MFTGDSKTEHCPKNGLNWDDLRDLQTHKIVTSQLIYKANQWAGFYMLRPKNLQKIRFCKSIVRKSLLLHFPKVNWHRTSDIWRFFTCSLQLIIIIIMLLLYFTCKGIFCPNQFETKDKIFLTISTQLLKMLVKNPV